jgi:lipopolysaccharide biosynthesis protein
MPKPAYFTVAETFIDMPADVAYHKGEVVADDDPILKKHPQFFVPLVVREHAGGAKVEQATAAPGEKRGK